MMQKGECFQSVAFIEISAPKEEDQSYFFPLLRRMGFTHVANHKFNRICLYRQNHILLTINCEGKGRGACREGSFVRAHGLCASAIGIFVEDLKPSFEEIVKRGAIPYKYITPYQTPVIQGVGDTLIYLCSKKRSPHDTSPYPKFFLDHFQFFEKENEPTIQEKQLITFHHVSFAIYPDSLNYWTDFFQKILELKLQNQLDDHHLKIRNFSNSGSGSLKISLVQSDPHSDSLTTDYLKRHQGEGLFQLSFTTPNLQQTLEMMTTASVFSKKALPAYYEKLMNYFSNSGRNLFALSKHNILVDTDFSKKTNVNYLHAILRQGKESFLFEIIEGQDQQMMEIGNLSMLLQHLGQNLK